MNLSDKILNLYKEDVERREQIYEMWAAIESGKATLSDEAFNALIFYGYHCYMPFTDMYKMLQMQDQRRNAKKQRYAWEKKHNAKTRVHCYEDFIKYYPQHLGALKSLAQQYLELGWLPNNYWYKFYANPRFSLDFEQLGEYLSILEILVELLSSQRKCEAQKEELARLERFQDFLLRLARQPQPSPVQNKYGQLNNFYMPFYLVESSYKRFEINYLLEEGRQLLMWQELINGDYKQHEFRAAKPFEELTAKRIGWKEFLGVQRKWDCDIFDDKLLEDLSGCGREDIGRGLVSDLFFGPYGSDKCKADYLTEKTPKARRRTFFSRLFEEGFGLVRGAVAEQVEIYAFSTNTSAYFEAGNEWYGANFWALVHKEKPQVAFLMSSFTD